MEYEYPKETIDELISGINIKSRLTIFDVTDINYESNINYIISKFIKVNYIKVETNDIYNIDSIIRNNKLSYLSNDSILKTHVIYLMRLSDLAYKYTHIIDHISSIIKNHKVIIITDANFTRLKYMSNILIKIEKDFNIGNINKFKILKYLKND